MASAGSVRVKVECLIDGKISNFTHTAAPLDLVSAVLQASVAQFHINASEWNVCKDQGRKDVLAPSTTLEFNGVKNGSRLWLGKVTSLAVHLHLRMFVFTCFLQIGGQSLVSVAVVDSHARPRLDPVDEELLREQYEHACRSSAAMPHVANRSGQKVEVFTCAEKSSVVTADQVPVDPWDPKVMTSNGQALSTMPFHAWLCSRNADRDKSLRKRSASPPRSIVCSVLKRIVLMIWNPFSNSIRCCTHAYTAPFPNLMSPSFARARKIRLAEP